MLQGNSITYHSFTQVGNSTQHRLCSVSFICHSMSYCPTIDCLIRCGESCVGILSLFCEVSFLFQLPFLSFSSFSSYSFFTTSSIIAVLLSLCPAQIGKANAARKLQQKWVCLITFHKKEKQVALNTMCLLIWGKLPEIS